MNFKRLIALILALLCLFALSACSSESKSADTTTAAAEEENTEPTNEIGQNGELIFEEANSKNLFENESCSFVLNRAQIDSLSDYCWDVTVKNTTASTLIFTVDEVYTNDFRFDPVWACRVEPGQTLDENIIWSALEMEARGITQITKVDLKLRVYDALDNSLEYANVSITNYPSGKSAYIAQKRNPRTTDVVLIDNNDYTIIVTGCDTEHRWGLAMDLYLLNKTDKPVVFTAENVLVVGTPIDPQWSCTLPAGKQALSQMLWFESDLEELGKINGISFDLLVQDMNGNVLTQSSHIFVP